MIVLPSTHNSLETAYLQDWSFGRRRCIRAIWIETNKRGQRACYATSNRGLSAEYEEWKEKTGQEIDNDSIRS